MSSYLSNLLTTTTSRYNNLRRNLLDSEADGDTEDDTHVCRVLRAYYTEKGKAFPQWLPPDPKAPQPAPQQFVTTSRPQQAAMGGRGGGLSDLWDAPQQQQAPPPEQASLRRGGPARGGPQRTLQPQPRANMVDTYEQRPLPSQRAGSYQSQNQYQQGGGRAEASPSPTPSAGGGSTAQERLKARLWGSGRTNSPAPSNAASASASSNQASHAAAQIAFDRGGGHQGTLGRNDSYESQSSRTGRGGGGAPAASSNPYMSANSPWSGGDDNPYGGGGGGGGGYDNGSSRSYGGPQRGPPGGRVGLPSGPRMR